MTDKHAILSPSSAHRWMNCPGAPAMEQGLPNTDSSYSREGTAAHELASIVLAPGSGSTCAAYVGRLMTNGVDVTEDMAEEVQKYADYVDDLVEHTGGSLLVEQKLPLEELTGEEGATGTGDAVILAPAQRELIVVDLKFGMGERVDAENNPQLLMYGAAALREYGSVAEFDTVRVVIHQPRLDHVSEWTVTIEQILAFEKQVDDAAARCWQQYPLGEYGRPVLNAGEKTCRWCKAKPTCPAVLQRVQDEVGIDFEDLTIKPVVEALPDIGAKLDAVDMIESWCKSVRARAEADLLAGKQVAGKAGPYKLVKGKKGNRAWDDEAAVEKLLKSFKVTNEHMYTYSLISPSVAEKLVKSEVLKPVQWKKLKETIKQADGKLHVAPATDKREAVKPENRAYDFEDLTKTGDDYAATDRHSEVFKND